MNRSNLHTRNTKANGMKRALSVCLAFALLGTACGDDDGNAPAALDEEAGHRMDAGRNDSGPAPAPIRDAMADAAPPVMTGVFPDRPEQPPPMMADAASLEPLPIPDENVVGGGAAGTSSDASVPVVPDAPDAATTPERDGGVEPNGPRDAAAETMDASVPTDPEEPIPDGGVDPADPVDVVPPVVNECEGDCDCVGTACECNGESHCVASCDPALGCDLSCSGPLPCTMQCNDNCFAECEGEMGCSVVLGPEGSARCGDGGDCSYVCEGSCSVACEVGSSCILSCLNPEADCPMDCGDSFAVDCGGGVFTCREACPLSEGGTGSGPIIDSGSNASLDGGG